MKSGKIGIVVCCGLEYRCLIAVLYISILEALVYLESKIPKWISRGQYLGVPSQFETKKKTKKCSMYQDLLIHNIMRTLEFLRLGLEIDVRHTALFRGAISLMWFLTWAGSSMQLSEGEGGKRKEKGAAWFLRIYCRASNCNWLGALRWIEMGPKETGVIMGYTSVLVIGMLKS